jgi:hypothetical protein
MTDLCALNPAARHGRRSVWPRIALALSVTFGAQAGDWSPPGTPGDGEYTRASNIGSMLNTRHNLTQSFINPGLGFAMNAYRNQYGQVCVYCHTPHGASSQLQAPLWNRTVNAADSYTSYSSQSLTQAAQNPGDASLTCLSCHDGTLPVDSNINMPGSGLYDRNQETTVNTTFLNAWSNVNSSLQMGFGPNCGDSPCFHSPLGAEGNVGEQGGTCMECHNNNNQFGIPEFSAFILGRNLANDHPVGVQYPDPEVFDFRSGLISFKSLTFFDKDGDARPDPNELRLYTNGDGARVECATCHDPHGVDSGNGRFIPSFLRVVSDGSTICLSCHVK